MESKDPKRFHLTADLAKLSATRRNSDSLIPSDSPPYCNVLLECRHDVAFILRDYGCRHLRNWARLYGKVICGWRSRCAPTVKDRAWQLASWWGRENRRWLLTVLLVWAGRGRPQFTMDV